MGPLGCLLKLLAALALLVLTVMLVLIGVARTGDATGAYLALGLVAGFVGFFVLLKIVRWGLRLND